MTTKEIVIIITKTNIEKIIWFNPLFCKHTNINIGKYFLNLINKHFQKTIS